MNKQIVGITGLKRSGKDTCAEYLVNRYAFDRHSFAQPLKDMLSVLMNCVDCNDRYYSEMHKEESIPGINASYRKLAQTLGTEWGRRMIDDNIWVNMLDANTEYVEKIVVSDVRFDNEAKWVKDNGGIIIKVTRPVLKSSKDNHPSEQGIDDSYVDHNIINDGTIEALHVKLDALFDKNETLEKAWLETNLKEMLDEVSLDEYNATVSIITQLSKKLNLSLKL
jgi:hypothetical protein